MQITTGANIYRSRLVLTAAEIRGLDTAAALVAPAMPGKILALISPIAKYKFGAIAFETPGGAAKLYYGPTDTDPPVIPDGDDLLNTLIDGTTASQWLNLPGVIDVSGPAPQLGTVSQPIYLVSTGAPLTTGAATTATVTSGNAGTGYAPGDQGTVNAGATSPTYTVLTVGAGGAVTSVSIAGGTGIATGTGFETAVTTGEGDGTLQLNIVAIATQGDGSYELDLLYQPV
jgi:hypothetical protein